ncbi:hypothetical protein H6P81_006604 [Aristolochia fimbriata]|uniref:Protein FAR1-RELATED SEQUENCE n=1 Tax=Aristolochia fimbriata TaxID=158543 RepID=A0AAV7EZY1_ARIFI|nr:hypothetical protein H6P81_006604 [Aristolochia fimbriata]
MARAQLLAPFSILSLLLATTLSLVSCYSSSNLGSSTCRPSGFLKGKTEKCNTEHDSDCCKAKKLYPQYRCSPPITGGNTGATMTINSFAKGGDGGGPSECDNKYHSDNELVVALSTGWYNHGSRCLQNIRINSNGKSVLAKVVDEFVKRLRQRETEADHEMNYSKPLQKTDFDVEKQMVDIYTQFIFYKFQAEVVESVKYGGLPLREERPYRIHEVYRCVQPDSINDVTQEVTMILIRRWHILLVLRNEKVCLLPESLILKRWTRTITREIIFDRNTVELCPNLDEVVRIRRNDLASKIHKILDVAFKSEEALSFLEKKIDVICDKIGQFEPDCGAKMRMPQEIHVHPPDIAKTKGSGKRLKGGKEKAMEQTVKKIRLCHGCGARDEHDKRNCPKLRDM